MLTSKSFINVIETNENFPKKSIYYMGIRTNMKSYNDTTKIVYIENEKKDENEIYL